MENRKSVKDSAIENQVYEIFPNDLNPRRTIFGGKVLELIDMLGGIVARRHSEKTCVTASMDSIDFIHPAKAGDLLIFKASVNNAWNTSCEVGVKVFVEAVASAAAKRISKASLVEPSNSIKLVQPPPILSATSVADPSEISPISIP